jgi:hypothetical protein
MRAESFSAERLVVRCLIQPIPAFWLRSSVVSVLFSLISESVLRNTTLINLIFGLRGWTSVLAHVRPHSVIGLTLSLIDANTFFINTVGLLTGWRRGLRLNFILMYIWFDVYMV